MKKRLKIVFCAIIIVVLLIVGYAVYRCTIPVYFVYAVVPSDDGGKSEWKEVYKSCNYDDAWELFEYLNQHKEKGVKGYILLDKEMGILNYMIHSIRLDDEKSELTKNDILEIIKEHPENKLW